MKRNILKISSIFCVSLLFLMTNTNHAFAQWDLPVNNFNLLEDFDTGVINLTNWLLWFVGVLSVIAIVWGGLNYIASSGDAQKAELSKMIIYYALIGLVVAGFAYAVMNIITGTILT